jgi:hypothetical protein
MADTLSQYGITWQFDKELSLDGAGDTYKYGQYCNGDYYIVGQCNIIDIDPATVNQGGTRWINGSMINPEVIIETALDEGSVTRLNYNHSKNVAVGVAPGNPLVLATNESLVSAQSDTGGDPKPFILDVAVLTCVVSAPSENSFRPPYCGTDKTSQWNESDLDYSHLLNLTTYPDTNLSWAVIEAAIERPWIDFYANWHYEWHCPSNNMPDYGRNMGVVESNVALKCNLNYSNSEKRVSVIGLTQVGIDFWKIYNESIAEDTFFWRSDGGNYIGRKFPIFFAGIMLNDIAIGRMKRIGLDGDQPVWATDNNVIHEDGQQFYVTQADIDITQGGSWDPDSRNPNPQYYDSSHLGMPEWAIRRNREPERSDASFAAYYRQCCTGNSTHGLALATLMMKGKLYWNNPAFFDYQKRYMQIMADGTDPFGYTVSGIPETFPQTNRSYSDTTEEMWDLYFSTYENSEQDNPSSEIYIMFTI